MTDIELSFDGAKPFGKQRPLLDHPGTVVCEGATKTGKTIITTVWQMGRFLQFAPRDKLPNGYRASGRHAWYGPTYRVAKISYDRAIKALHPLEQAGLVKGVTTPLPKIIGLGKLSGREWHFLSTENVSLIYGEEWDDVVIEEFTRHKSGAIDAIKTTAHPKRAPMRLIGNLRDKVNDGFKLARQVQDGDGLPGWLYLGLTCYDARDAGLVTDAELDAIRADYGKRGVLHLFARDWENRFDDAGQPFPATMIAGCVRHVDVPDRARCALLLDAGGKENPGAIVRVRLWQQDGAARAHIDHAEHYIGDLPGFERRVRDRVSADLPAAITFDSYAPMLGDILAASYPKAAQKTNSKTTTIQGGYESVHGMISAGTLTIAPGACEPLIRDLDYVVHKDGEIAFALYEHYYEETDRMHQVHADAANALLQGITAALTAMSEHVPASHVRVHGTPLHRQTPQTAVRTGRDWR
jgi:hypothetical protein